MKANTYCSTRDAARTRRLWFLSLCAACFLFFFWVQTINVPYWGDDYDFLLNARQFRLENQSWYAPFFPETKVLFWRPLGMETYWRFVETFLGGDAVFAHIANILLLIAAAAAVGWFVADLVSLLVPELEKLPAAITAAFFYGVHSSHFLPAAWISAANDSIAVLFSALTLRFWLAVITSHEKRILPPELMLIPCIIMALLSRDIAFVLPLLGGVLALWLWPRYKPSLQAWGVGVICIGIALAWLVARNHFTMSADPAYTMRFGINFIRNAGCLILFLFNTPFESLRYFFFVKASVGFAAWGIVSFILQAVSFSILLRMTWPRLGRRGLIMLCLFFVVGCAPYFLLSFNCYPYYTSIGLFAYAVVAGLAAPHKRAVATALVLTLISSAVSTAGNYFLDSPAHIGRARWAEKQLQKMEALIIAQPGLFTSPLYVLKEDIHKFESIKASGIAYRLNLDKKNIIVINPDDPEAEGQTVLVVPKEGDVYFRSKDK